MVLLWESYKESLALVVEKARSFAIKCYKTFENPLFHWNHFHKSNHSSKEMKLQSNKLLWRFDKRLIFKKGIHWD